ncbi:hypothetical protein ES332_A08G190100v1 [Gossypium tomentosum]|uniref:PH domain-containing protein n=2 Tax=Gossypium tomentosum TaxID=34277 RepID=A0A5D2PGS2_GOSTO|nr:hypothetical protein ES332_A08G190100v1 [Gossypium tomentosum]TYI15497.1 hypothetical protein ES332_A08G190100v1 [Gossypium tomentosum]TYI15498.1 hypothetical protein ES332_A08G190100v1 [Gossypium tomentosum]
MLEDQVAYLLQRYLGNYVRGLNKEALKISVWKGDVELTNMQLKPEALNALKLPVKVKAGFLGSVKLKVPWSRLGQDPVLVYLDQIFLLAEPATFVEGCSEDAIQEAKKNRVREMEMKLLERMHHLKSEMNKSWLGSLISTIIGNLKLSISNIHIRYEDLESNPGHPFAAGLTLEKLSAVTVDDSGKETFVTGGALDRIQKSVELDRLALYLDSDILPWHIDKLWEDLLPSEWIQVFRFGTKDGRPADHPIEEHAYILQPVTGNAKYSKLRQNGSSDSGEPLQKGAVSLDDVTLCLSKDGYRDILKLADNFTAFNQRLKYAHYRPTVSLKSDPRSWWKYAYKAVSDQMKKASGKLSWEQVLRYTRLQKKYISLYASLLKSDVNRPVVDDCKEIEELDRGLDIELILQWRMLAHKFVRRSIESENYLKQQKAKKSWWSLGWASQSLKDDGESFSFSEEDWEKLNKIIGYKEDDDQSLMINAKPDILQTSLEIHMKRNASKLLDGACACLAELSCEGLNCSIKLYPETKVFDVNLGSYQLSSPNGLLAESATTSDSLVGVFCYKPFDTKVDWSLVAKASPCYATFLKESIDEVINFFESNIAVSQTMAVETATAVQMTIDGVRRSAQQQVNKALKDHARFLLDLDIAAPKITIPTEFRPNSKHSTKLLLDLGNLIIRSQDDYTRASSEVLDLYLQFDLVLSDVSAFLVDGDYHWSQTFPKKSAGSTNVDVVSFLPVIEKCGVILKLQQIRLENPSYPSTRLAVQLPSLGFHFSPARYHRLMQVIKIFREEDKDNPDIFRPWNQADFEGWLFVLSRKGVGNREAVWQRRYLCLVGPFLYVLETPGSKSYKQYVSLRGKQVYLVPTELAGDMESVLAVCDAARSNSKVVEDVNALILQCDDDDSRKAWQRRLQGAIYHASASAPITSLSETSSDSETEPNDKHDTVDLAKIESVFITGVLDELKISFSYNHEHEWSFIKVLLAEEYPLFEFRAIGGQVELSIKGNDMFIGTMLKSLEIEDMICCSTVSKPCYLARSFIRSADAHSVLEDASIVLSPSEGDEKFYEAPENLVDSVESTTPTPRKASELVSLQGFLSSGKTSLPTQSFSRVTGLLPDGKLLPRTEDIELSDTLNSFVKAQIVIYDQNSPLYDNIDMKVTVTLATLSFFCRRPTILAIMEFASSITIEEESCESFSDSSSAVGVKRDISSEDPTDNLQSTSIEEPVVKGLLGKGKSRIIFNLTLNMAHAQILLMNENETKFATLSQENLRTDIKVFPSSFSINAALGNLRISDDSLPSNHMYFWICDMRDPGGTSFVELVFTSFSIDDEDYEGFEYSLFGQLSEVRIVYLNRFVQEVISYFMGLVPKDSKSVVKLKDQGTNSEKWFTTSEIEGSPALRLDLSLRKPIILMPRKTDSFDYLKLDVVHITVQNTFHWFCGSKSDLNAVHFEIMTIMVEDINLNVGTESDLSESIIKDVKGVSIVIRRSLRDLMHQIPSIEADIKIEELKAELSNREYMIITECALSNISETPHIVPPIGSDFVTSSEDVVEDVIPQTTADVEPRTPNDETWTAMKVSVVINLVEMGLYVGEEWRSPLATVQASGTWLLYMSNTLGEGFLSASLKGFTVIDNRVGTKEEFKLAIAMPKNPVVSVANTNGQFISNENVTKGNNIKPFPTMLLLDAKFGQSSTSVSICVQKPQLLVALDFLLALVEFFVPTVGTMLTDEEDKKSLHMVDAIILDKSTYTQPLSQFSLCPVKPLIADDEKFDHFIYDGNGGILHLKDREGIDLCAPSSEAMIYVGNGKKLQFKNVLIKNGHYLDSCISLGTNSGYSASKDDLVYFEGGEEDPQVDTAREIANQLAPQNAAVDRSAEFIVEFQAIGPELTFYNASKDVGESSVLSNKLLHAQLDAFGRLVLKGDNVEMTANALGLTMESNGVRILEPFDTTIKYSNASGKTNIHLSVSDIFMNFSFSILRLFLAVEEDILAFLRRTSREMTVNCSQFDRVGTIRNPDSDQIYSFWRACAPVGFAVLGDCLTPLDKPPTKGVLAVNTNYVPVKRPLSFKRIWPPLDSGGISDECEVNSKTSSNGVLGEGESCCSVWLPEPPEGYVALGCVVSPGKLRPSSSSTFCILDSFVSPCSLRDCITTSATNRLAFWRVDNSLGTFLPAEPTTLRLLARAYELRYGILRSPEFYPKASRSSDIQASVSGRVSNQQSNRSTVANSGRRFEAVASFRLVWWNRGSSSRKQISIWRPEIPLGMVYFGDIAVQGYEPPNTCIVLHDAEDEELFKAPSGFQPVGQIKKQRGMENISFWLPQAPPGYVSLGCIACKGPPKQQDICTLRCIRSDMVTGDQFLEESVWDTTDAKFGTVPFSIWVVANELGTFFVRGGSRKPPRRFALKLADPYLHSGSDDTVIDAEITTFSAALFDDYGGLMVPLFNISLSGIAFSLRGRPDYSNSNVSFSLAARSYNDKYESWEPIVEPMDGFLRYQYDPSSPGAATQLRFTSTRDLNLNISVSNANMIIQAYASWNNLSAIHQYYKRPEACSPTSATRSIVNVHQKRSYYIIPQNKLGQDIYVRATERRGFSDIIKMPAGNMKPINVPVSKSMLDCHLKGELCRKIRTMVTIIIADAVLPRVEGLSSHQYTVAVRLSPSHSLPSESLLHQQSARTCGRISSIMSSDSVLVDWSEMFFFIVDSPDSYTLELIVADVGKGDAIGFFSAPLDQIAVYIPDDSLDYANSLMWRDLFLAPSMNITQADRSSKKSSGKLRCAAILPPKFNVDETNEPFVGGRKSGFIQISPSMEGPWTTVQLNYAAPTASWHLGNDIVAGEVSVKDGNRYVNIRSLVSVHNNTDFTLDLCLVSKASSEAEQPTDVRMPEGIQFDGSRIQTDEFFETEKYDPNIGWIGCNVQLNQDQPYGGGSQQAAFGVELPSGWDWLDDWHLDTPSTSTAGGWVHAPDVESLKWPELDDSIASLSSARQRRWIRNRKQISLDAKELFVAELKPGDTVPLPLSALSKSRSFVFQLRPSNVDGSNKYSWSSVVGKPGQPEVSEKPKGTCEIYVSALTESEELLCCTQLVESSSNASSPKLWFCLGIQATEISKDICSDPILDWSLVIKSPLSITNYLPLTAEYSILEMRPSGHFIACSRGIFHPGGTVNIYNADICRPLFFSLLPQRGWLPLREAVLISHPHEIPSKTISLKSSISGRIVQLVIEQNYDKEQTILSKTIRVYAPYWFSVSRCPPLTYRLVDIGGKKSTRKIRFPLRAKKENEGIEEITDEEMYNGHTIASSLNFDLYGLCVAVTGPSNEHFGPVKDLSPLSDMDGSLDLYAYNADGRCMHLFVSAKPCPYQSVPTKVITVRPYMTFTNRIGQDLYIKLSNEDEPNVLCASDSRVSFVHYKNDGMEKLQIRLEDTEWSFPVQIVKEDTISLVLRRRDATRTFLNVVIRGYEEGSHFIVVFRLGSAKGPIRIENRTTEKTICIRQSGFGENTWISLGALSTTNFSWEDPYGQKFIDAKIYGDCDNQIWKIDLERAGQFSEGEGEFGMQLHVFEISNIKVVRFTNDWTWKLSSHEDRRSLTAAGEPQIDVTPIEIIIELGVVGVSVVDHMTRELLYLYLDRLFISYSTGYDGGTTSRFKLILGYLQIDNQLPLTLMPVLLAPEQMSDIHHPVFKMTITMRNVNSDGVQVYPYVYIRVTDKHWRLNVHEPIIWALVDFYNNLQLDHIPQSSSVTQVDPEIRVDLIDVSEVRLKVSLETAPAQRPQGVLGVWSPILSAIGNAFKIQVHLRRVMRKDRFMRRSSILPAIENRIWRDLIHNPLHLLFSVDVLGMTSSTLASLSKGFAELSTDGQFLQLRSKQVTSRRITGVGDGIIQGTEALAQGVAFGVSGIVRKPVESTRQNGFTGLAHGIGRACLGFIVQPVSGALDFFSLTVGGIEASCSKCLEALNNRSTFQRIRNPRAIHSDGILREYSEKEAAGQMVLYLAEASRRFGCTEIFKEPSKFAWSDYYEEHFIVPYQKILLVTNKRVTLLQCSSLDKMDKKPCKIIWDVPWEELMALELAKAGSHLPSCLLLHLKNFRRSEAFVRVIKCNVEEVEGTEPQAVQICSVVRKMWRMHQSDLKSIVPKVPSSHRLLHFSWSETDKKAPHAMKKSIIKSGEFSSSSSGSDGIKMIKHSMNFLKIWSSERELKGRCTLCRKQVADDGGVCSIWRPICPDGYVSIGDIARVGTHPPNVAAVYRNIDKLYALPVGYDLVWRNCLDDYTTPVSIWYPRAPDGFFSLGCVAVAGFEEPEADLVRCVAETVAEETTFEEQKVWCAPESYPWGCHVYQVQSDALHFVALRETKEESNWKPSRVRDDFQSPRSSESQ